MTRRQGANSRFASKPIAGMHKLALLGVLSVIGLVLTITAAPASATVVNVRGHVYGVLSVNAGQQGNLAMRSRGLLAPSALSGTAGLSYHGGPVMHGFTTHAIYWDPGSAIAGSTQGVINQYFSDVAHDSGLGSNVYSVNAQYTDSSGSATYSSSFGGALVDSSGYPASGCPANAHGTTYETNCLSDAQISAELSSFVHSHGLPTGPSNVYSVFTPHNVAVCLNDTSCSDNSFCSYHTLVPSSTAGEILYTLQPFTWLDATNGKRCQSDNNYAPQQPNGNIADLELKLVSHELSETITNPQLNAWYDANNSENGDLCNAYGVNPNSFLPVLGGDPVAGTLFNQSIAGRSYYTQGEWSNATGSCQMSTGAAPTASAPAAPPVTTIVSTPGNRSLSSTATFTFSSSSPNSSFKCSIDRHSSVPCTSGVTYKKLALGSHSFAVRATDTLGQQELAPVVYNWIRHSTVNLTIHVTSRSRAASFLSYSLGRGDKVAFFLQEKVRGYRLAGVTACTANKPVGSGVLTRCTASLAARRFVTRGLRGNNKFSLSRMLSASPGTYTLSGTALAPTSSYVNSSPKFTTFRVR